MFPETKSKETSRLELRENKINFFSREQTLSGSLHIQRMKNKNKRGGGGWVVKTSCFPYPVLPPPLPYLCVSLSPDVRPLYCVAPVFRLIIKRIRNPDLLLKLCHCVQIISTACETLTNVYMFHVISLETFSYMFTANRKLQYEICSLPFAGDKVRRFSLTSTSKPYGLTNFSLYTCSLISTVFVSVKKPNSEVSSCGVVVSGFKYSGCQRCVLTRIWRTKGVIK